jgi:hypothetical protein
MSKRWGNRNARHAWSSTKTLPGIALGVFAVLVPVLVNPRPARAGFGNCPAPGDCFTPHANPGCSNESCCTLVCAEDDDCCRFEWDSLCVDAAEALCGGSACPGTGSCFAQHPTPGCNDANCCNAVCGKEPLCCVLDWDSSCVSAANDLCRPSVCPAGGRCFQPHATPGCENDGCCRGVCALDAYCCDVEWDCVCAERAGQLCGQKACPGEGSCLEEHASSGCADEFCCNTVCLSDPDCCRFGWDDLCVQRAQEVCAACPGTGRCDVGHATPGCDNRDCCQAVCTAEESCCQGQWGLGCVQRAGQLCANPACPSPGSCDTTHENPGCLDAECCHAVCLRDPDCCGFAGWDSICVQRAKELCGPAPNDEPENAIPMECDETHAGSTVGATLDANLVPCGLVNDAPGIWYRVIGNGRVMTANTCQSDVSFDTRLSVFMGECPREFSCVGGNNDFCGLQSSVPWRSVVGEHYLILVRGSLNRTGPIVTNLTCSPVCPAGEAVWVDPPNGVVDARQPHPVNSTLPRQGIERLIVRAPRRADFRCWSVCETRESGFPIAFVRVEEVDGLYTLRLTRPMTPGAVTTVTYHDSPVGQTGRFISHPANINGDGATAAFDILAIIDCLNNVNPAVACPWGFPYSRDVDHSGVFNSSDLLRTIDLINGAGAFATPWLGTTRPTGQGCP